MKTFRDLNPRGKISVVLLYARMNLRVVFGLKALFCLAATAVYFAIFYAIVASSGESLTVVEVLAWLVWLPATIFAVLFSMEIISQEQDAGVLEAFFTVSVSPYRLWTIKIATLLLGVCVLALALIALTDQYVFDLPVALTLAYVFPPLLFFAGLTMLFSAMFKSANAAGLCAVAILAFVMLTAEGLSTTVVFPYLNPFERPMGTEPFIWVRTVVYNKIAYTLLGCVWFWRALRWLDRRERLLK